MIYPVSILEEEKFGQKLKSCLDCNSTCWEAFIYSLNMGGRYLEATHIGLLLYCAGLCDKSIDAILRGSENTNLYAVTSRISELCAKSCDQFEDDQIMKICAQNCRSCAVLLNE